jgi:hypothetical protein
MRETANLWNPAQLASGINHDGFAVVENFVQYDSLKNAQNFVKDAVAANGGHYLHIAGHERLIGTFLHDLPSDPEFVNLCRGIYECGTGQPAPNTEFYQILRCLSGDLVQKHSMVFHYDSYVLTGAHSNSDSSRRTAGRSDFASQHPAFPKNVPAQFVRQDDARQPVHPKTFKKAVGAWLKRDRQDQDGAWKSLFLLGLSIHSH